MAKFINSPQRDRESQRNEEDNGESPRQARGRYEEDEEDRDDPDREDDRNDRKREKQGAPKLPGAQAVIHARQYLEGVMGMSVESVSGLNRSHAGWKVNLDVVELERIPRSTDVMASYEVELDEDGELVGCRRLSRFYRNQVDES